MNNDCRKIIPSLWRVKFESLERPRLRQFRGSGHRTGSDRQRCNRLQWRWRKIDNGNSRGNFRRLSGSTRMLPQEHRKGNETNSEGGDCQPFLRWNLLSHGCGIAKLRRCRSRWRGRQLVTSRVAGYAGYVRLLRLEWILFLRFVRHGEPLCGIAQLDLVC